MRNERIGRKKGAVLVVYGIATIEDVYGVVRWNVPYRPKSDFADGINCRSADDAFKLFWRYTEPKKLGYMSSTDRQLHLDGTHSLKVANELNQRHAKVVVLERGKQRPKWLRDALDMVSAEVVTTMPARNLPPGVDREAINYFEALAWRLVYAWAQRQEWPKVQMPLQVWKAVGQGKDAKIIQEEKRPREAIRIPTPEEIAALQSGEMVVDELLATGVRLNAQGRQLAANAQEFGHFNQNGKWKTHIYKDGEWVRRV